MLINNQNPLAEDPLIECQKEFLMARNRWEEIAYENSLLKDLIKETINSFSHYDPAVHSNHEIMKNSTINNEESTEPNYFNSSSNQPHTSPRTLTPKHPFQNLSPQNKSANKQDLAKPQNHPTGDKRTSSILKNPSANKKVNNEKISIYRNGKEMLERLHALNQLLIKNPINDTILKDFSQTKQEIEFAIRTKSVLVLANKLRHKEQEFQEYIDEMEHSEIFPTYTDFNLDNPTNYAGVNMNVIPRKNRSQKPDLSVSDPKVAQNHQTGPNLLLRNEREYICQRDRKQAESNKSIDRKNYEYVQNLYNKKKHWNNSTSTHSKNQINITESALFEQNRPSNRNSSTKGRIQNYLSDFRCDQFQSKIVSSNRNANEMAESQRKNISNNQSGDKLGMSYRSNNDYYITTRTEPVRDSLIKDNKEPEKPNARRHLDRMRDIYKQNNSDQRKDRSLHSRNKSKEKSSYLEGRYTLCGDNEQARAKSSTRILKSIIKESRASRQGRFSMDGQMTEDRTNKEGDLYKNIKDSRNSRGKSLAMEINEARSRKSQNLMNSNLNLRDDTSCNRYNALKEMKSDRPCRDIEDYSTMNYKSSLRLVNTEMSDRGPVRSHTLDTNKRGVSTNQTNSQTQRSVDNNKYTRQLENIDQKIAHAKEALEEKEKRTIKIMENAKHESLLAEHMKLESTHTEERSRDIQNKIDAIKRNKSRDNEVEKSEWVKPSARNFGKQPEVSKKVGVRIKERKFQNSPDRLYVVKHIPLCDELRAGGSPSPNRENKEEKNITVDGSYYKEKKERLQRYLKKSYGMKNVNLLADD